MFFFKLKFLQLSSLCVHVQMQGWNVEVRGQDVEIISLLLPHAFWDPTQAIMFGSKFYLLSSFAILRFLRH